MSRAESASTILVTAEFFGFGPIVTCINIIEKLKKRLQGHYIFLGSGISMEYAVESKLFDEIVECKTYDYECLKEQEEIFNNSDFVLSVENLQGAIYSVRCGHKVYYIDNLFWMWKDIPKELEEVEAYFIVDIFDVDKNIDRIGRNIKRIIKIGPLRELNYISKKSKKNQLVYDVGGAESFLSDYKLVSAFYTKLFNYIYDAVQDKGIERILVCGGNNIVKSIEENLGPVKNVSFRSYNKNEFLDVLGESKYVIMTPGLGNYFEALGCDQDVLILPPINYSQFWQNREYKKEKLGFTIINWDEFPWYKEIEKYEDEDVGVKQVLDNVKLFLQDTDGLFIIKKYVEDYFSLYTGTWRDEREKYIGSIGKSGIDEIVNIILEDQRC